MIYKVLLLFAFTCSCLSVPVGSVLERSKYDVPSWKSEKYALIPSKSHSEVSCVGKFDSRGDLPKAIKEAQLEIKQECSKMVARSLLAKNSKLARRFTEKNLIDYFGSCSTSCVVTDDIYYEIIAELESLFSNKVYIKMTYRYLLK